MNTTPGSCKRDLSAYFHIKIFGAEKELICCLVHILVQKGAIKQWEFNVPLYQTIDINYSLAHKVLVLQNV